MLGSGEDKEHELFWTFGIKYQWDIQAEVEQQLDKWTTLNSGRRSGLEA